MALSNPRERPVPKKNTRKNNPNRHITCARRDLVSEFSIVDNPEPLSLMVCIILYMDRMVFCFVSKKNPK